MANETEPEDSAIESLETLFALLEAPLLAYATTLVQSSETAQDIVQEAFVRLHGDFDRVRQRRAWLYRTVHNLAANQRRKQRKIVPWIGKNSQEPVELADQAPTPAEALQHFEIAEATRRCLEVLDARSRQVVELKFDQKRSYREISEATGLGIGNVGYVLHHALRALAIELKKKGIAP